MVHRYTVYRSLNELKISDPGPPPQNPRVTENPYSISPLTSMRASDGDGNRLADVEMVSAHKGQVALSSASLEEKKKPHREGFDVVKHKLYTYCCLGKRSPALDFIIYLLFIITLTWFVVVSKNGKTSFFLSEAVQVRIFEEEFPVGTTQIRKTFQEAEELEEVIIFYEKILVPALFGDRSHCKKGTASLCPGTLNGDNFLLAAPRLSQVRVKPIECFVDQHILNFKGTEKVASWMQHHECYAEYNEGQIQNSPEFNKTVVSSEIYDCFTYKTRRIGYRIFGQLADFGYSLNAYECSMPSIDMNSTAAEAFFEDLVSSEWIDRGTRLISIDFPLYNPGLGFLIVVRAVFEKSIAGQYLPWHDILVLDLNRPNRTEFSIALSLLIVFLVIFMQQLLTECKVRGRKCIAFWNVLEFINVALFILYFIIIAAGYAFLDHETGTKRIDYVHIAYPFEMAEMVLSANCICSVLVLFKHVRVSKRLSLLLTTLYNSRETLFAMLMITLIFIIGFALAIYVAFGHRVYGFRTFSQTLLNLMFSVFTEFEYLEEITTANRYLGPAIMLIYFIFVDLVLISMLIAVVEDAFSAAQDDLRTNADRDKLLESFQKSLYHMKGASKVAKIWIKKRGENLKSVVSHHRKSSLQQRSSTRSVMSEHGTASTSSLTMDKKKKGSFKGRALGIQSSFEFKKQGKKHHRQSLSFEEKDEVDDDLTRELQHLSSANHRKKTRSLAKIKGRLRNQTRAEKHKSLNQIKAFFDEDPSMSVNSDFHNRFAKIERKMDTLMKIFEKNSKIRMEEKNEKSEYPPPLPESSGSFSYSSRASRLMSLRESAKAAETNKGVQSTNQGRNMSSGNLATFPNPLLSSANTDSISVGL